MKSSASIIPSALLPGAISLWPPRIVAFHATQKNVGNIIAADGTYNIRLTKSESGSDWLGDAIYFFPNESHAIRWARKGLIQWNWPAATVVRFEIELRRCLDLTEYGSTKVLGEAHKWLRKTIETSGLSMPKNNRLHNGWPMRRWLDCSVINALNLVAKSNPTSRKNQEFKYDTVVCAFVDGKAPYPGSSFREETHIQIAVNTQECLSNPSIAWSS